MKTFGDQNGILVLPELALTGYPPKDLLLENACMTSVQSALDDLITYSELFPQLGLLVGAPVQQGDSLYNAAVLIHYGQKVDEVYKTHLPNYDVFDEQRYFATASEVRPILFNGQSLGVQICEDAWVEGPGCVSEQLVQQGATCLINLSASPFEQGKPQYRKVLFSNMARQYEVPVVFVNQVGGNDDLIFDGHSMAFNAKGEQLTQLAGFDCAAEKVDLLGAPPVNLSPKNDIEMVFEALKLGLKDYVEKCGFNGVVLGLSGGIDSAVTAAIAVSALGPEAVRGLLMPSVFSSEGSVQDAKELAQRAGFHIDIVPINPIMETFQSSLDTLLPNELTLAHENLQARIRGDILMAISNQTGYLLLSTGNKSELAVGYCTLYGDMCGGLSVLSDVPKGMVYQLAHYINSKAVMIPISTINKAPSAELRPNQKDQDSLPEYSVLDQILEGIIDHGQSEHELIESGLDAHWVDWVAQKVRQNEHKRRQAPLGLKVTSKAFGSGRRMPIAARVSWPYQRTHR